MLIPLRNCHNLEVDRVRVLCIHKIIPITFHYQQATSDPECTTREPVFIDINKEGATGISINLLISIKRALPVFIDINKEGATGIY